MAERLVVVVVVVLELGRRRFEIQNKTTPRCAGAVSDLKPDRRYLTLVRLGEIKSA